MRLTLRTMLAYMDNVLEPADAEILGKKIEESDFASGLIQRIKGVLKKLRLDAPKLDGKGMGNDANTIAEYLDSSLPQDRVGEFERVCLESDKHLCEVAACHQILTLVLGRAADVPVELRERVYALGDPTRAGVHVTGAATAATAGAKAGPPPMLNTNGQPGAEVAPLEVPEYLRAGRQTNLWPFVAVGATALALTLLVLWRTGALDRAFRGSQQVTMNPDDAGGGKSDVEKAAASVTKSAGVDQTVAKTGDNEVAPSDAVPPPVPAAAVEGTAPSTAPAAAAIDRPPTESPDRVAAATPAPAPVPRGIPDTDDSPAPAAPTSAVTPKVPKAKGPAAVAPVKPQPIEVGRYTSDGQLLATLDPDDGLWYRKQAQELLTAGERLVVLPPYRPQIALPSAVQLKFAGEGAVRMEEPGENNIPRVTVEYGRFLVATASKAGAQVELDLAGIKGVLTLVDADSDLAIKVIRWVPPGADPEAADGIPVIEIYNVKGRATWQQTGQAKVDLPARHVHVYYDDDPPETHGPFLSPEWLDDRSVKPIDRDAAIVLDRLVDFDRPLNLSLQEVTRDRAAQALNARCLAALGDFEPILRELSDPNQYAFWAAEFEALRHSLSRGKETAAKVRETLGLLRTADAKELYRLLWGYSEEQLDKGAGGQLVKFLEHEQMDVRVLAHVNLVSITGAWGSYRPERAPAQMKTSIQGWSEKQKKGTIVYKMPPSPLDTYKPLAAPAGEPRPAPPGTAPAPPSPR